jgi:spore maturation protein CgeB
MESEPSDALLFCRLGTAACFVHLMKLVIFGLTVSSSWGNGHATLWRGLIRALARRGDQVIFFERDVPYYAAHRDLTSVSHAKLVLYSQWSEISVQATGDMRDADAVLITSYCPDAIPAARELFSRGSRALRVFYDLDTPVTLAQLSKDGQVDYIPANGLQDFDLVLSYTGGSALSGLQQRLGARSVATLYGHVDTEVHQPAARPAAQQPGALSYLGTFAPDRQAALSRLFIEPARRRPQRCFDLAGSGYPADFPWTANVRFRQHLAPAQHPEFFASAGLTLNVTRADMAACGFCPSGRLFEAAACGTPILTDHWEGLDSFFTPGEEILVARSTDDALAAIDSSPQLLERVARAARERTLSEHTSAHRARQLVNILEGAQRCGA